MLDDLGELIGVFGDIAGESGTFLTVAVYCANQLSPSFSRDRYSLHFRTPNPYRKTGISNLSSVFRMGISSTSGELHIFPFSYVQQRIFNTKRQGDVITGFGK